MYCLDQPRPHDTRVGAKVVAPRTVAEPGACGRARWKIGNETFGLLRTNGYNLERNFGHGDGNSNGVLRKTPRYVPSPALRKRISLLITTLSGSCCPWHDPAWPYSQWGESLHKANSVWLPALNVSTVSKMGQSFSHGHPEDLNPRGLLWPFRYLGR